MRAPALVSGSPTTAIQGRVHRETDDVRQRNSPRQLCGSEARYHSSNGFYSKVRQPQRAYTHHGYIVNHKIKRPRRKMINTVSRLHKKLSRVKNHGVVEVLKRRCATALAAEVTTKPKAEPETEESWSAGKPYQEIPGPQPLPVIGNLHRFLPGGEFYGMDQDHLAMQEKLYNTYGPIVRLSALPGRDDILYLFDPEDLCKVFRTEGPMPTRSATPSVYHYRTVTRPEWFKGVGGALVAQGEEWYNFRTKVNQLMLQPKSVQRYVGPVDEVAEDFLNRIHALRDDKLELPSNFENELFKWGLETVTSIALDTRLGCLDASKDSEAQKMIDASRRIFFYMYIFQTKPFLWKMGNLSSAWRQFVRDFDLMTQTAQKHIQRKLAQMEAEDAAGGKTDLREPSVMERLLRAQPPEVAAVLAADMLTGGAETTSKSMGSALAHLAAFPREQQLLAEELRRELPGARPALTPALLQRLPRLRAFLRESMRFTSTVPALPRNLTHKLVLSGYQVPQGTEILGGQLLMSRQGWNVPRGNEFLPDRWLKGHALHGKANPFASLPFGFGPRMCIGRRFAELEMQVLTAKMVHRYVIEYHHGEISFKGSPMNGPAVPLKFRLIERD